MNGCISVSTCQKLKTTKCTVSIDCCQIKRQTCDVGNPIERADKYLKEMEIKKYRSRKINLGQTNK